MAHTHRSMEAFAVKIRAAAAVAAALVLGSGLTACNMISPQRTSMHYDASDGVSATLGTIDVRNALLLVNDDTRAVDTANLVVALVNKSGKPATVTAKVGSSLVTITAEGGAQAKLTEVGYGEGGEQLVNGSFQSGSTVPVEFTAKYTNADGSSATESVTLDVPVLGSSNSANVLREYATLLPTPEPTLTPLGETPAPTAAPATTAP